MDITALLSVDYLNELLPVVLPCVGAGMLLPFPCWAVGTVAYSLFNWVRAVL